MKRFTMFVVALAVAGVFASVATAYATTAKTWHNTEDYYSWNLKGNYEGNDQNDPSVELGKVGDNPNKPGVHANYTANTAKCGICHSVHRAKGNGVKLLNTDNATCAGCHVGSTAVTKVLVTWGAGQGPHGSSSAATCDTEACHSTNPHGANSSDYAIVAAKLLNEKADVLLTVAANDPDSLITVNELNDGPGSTWDSATQSAVRTGYTCNVEGCHFNTLLTVLNRKDGKGYAEPRWANGSSASTPKVSKTGHLSVAAASMTKAFAPVAGCVSCHDQTDGDGYTFPHGQVAVGASNVPAGKRAWLWMTIAENAQGDDFGYMAKASDKAKDGACLKCHRSGELGIGKTH